MSGSLALFAHGIPLARVPKPKISVKPYKVRGTSPSDLASAHYGRPTLIVDYKLLDVLAREAMTVTEIAPLIRMSVTSIRRRLRDDPRFRAIAEKGWAEAQPSTLQMLVKKAPTVLSGGCCHGHPAYPNR